MRRALALSALLTCSGATAKTAPGLLCSGVEPRPKIAICLSGLARTFRNPLVHMSLKENVLEALGAPVTAFAYFRTLDLNGTREEEQQLLAVAAAIGINETRIDSGLIRAPFAGPQCKYPKVNLAKEPVPGDAASIVGQAHNRRQCYDMISDHETRLDVHFDWVLYTRPDLTWYRPLRPFCFFNLPLKKVAWRL